MVNVLFVCSGNTCRSALAEAMMKKVLMERPTLRLVVRCASAGLNATEGAKAEHGAIAVAQQEDMDLARHRARRLNADMVSRTDLILTMTSRQKDRVIERYPDCANHVYTLREYVTRMLPVERNRQQNPIIGQILAMEREPLRPLDIPDPMGQSLEAYQECARQIKAAVAALARLMGEARGGRER